MRIGRIEKADCAVCVFWAICCRRFTAGKPKIKQKKYSGGAFSPARSMMTHQGQPASGERKTPLPQSYRAPLDNFCAFWLRRSIFVKFNVLLYCRFCYTCSTTTTTERPELAEAPGCGFLAVLTCFRQNQLEVRSFSSAAMSTYTHRPVR